MANKGTRAGAKSSAKKSVKNSAKKVVRQNKRTGFAAGDFIRWRFWCASALLAAMPLALAWQLAHLQVIPDDEKGPEFLKDQGKARTVRSHVLNAYRGVISDRNGEVLAVSTEAPSIVVNPQQIRAEDIPSLAYMAGISEKELRERLTTYANKQFMYLLRHISPQEANAILAKGFRGVTAEEGYQRFYPAGEVAAHVVGFTNVEDRGQEGIELAFDHILAGERGRKTVLEDLKGNVVKELGIPKSPRAGKDLQLSIDLRLQYLAYRELKAAVAKQNAIGGSVVMLDVDSGDVLAMVNQPSYNPNNRADLKAWMLRNRAVTDVFEPGSTMKPFAMAAALESGRYTPQQEINTHPGYMKVGSKTLLDPVNYGVMDLTKIITKSSQVGISKIALDLGAQPIRDLMFRAGLGQSTGIGFPGESIGVLPERARWRDIETANLAFGYGLNVNALQLAQAYAVLAAGGEFRPVNLIANSPASAGKQKVLDKRISQEITRMLKTVALPGGTATRAQIHEYPVAGKSGTAHKIGEDGYADDRYMAIFAGFAPADNPAIVTVVVINEPADNQYYGGEAAAPVFAHIVKDSLQVLNEAPVKVDQYLSAVAQ